jgi:hypothetical protein
MLKEIVAQTAQTQIKVQLVKMEAGRINLAEFLDAVDTIMNPVRDFLTDSKCDLKGDSINEFYDGIKSIIPMQYRYDTEDGYWHNSACYELPKEDIMDDLVFDLLKRAVQAAADNWDEETVTGTFADIHRHVLERIANGYENPQALAQRALSIKVNRGGGE